MPLNDNKLLYVHHCKISKEIWDSLEMIYGVSSSIKQKEINICEEDVTFKCLSNFRSISNYVGNCMTNKYLRAKNWKFIQSLNQII